RVMAVPASEDTPKQDSHKRSSASPPGMSAMGVNSGPTNDQYSYFTLRGGMTSSLTLSSFGADRYERPPVKSGQPISRVHSKPGRTRSPAMGTITHMPLVVPLFIQNRNFTSTLVIVNDSKLNTYADVSLTALDGREITSQRVQFSPHSQQRVEILALLQAAPSSVTTGSIRIMQSPDLKGMPIAAQLSITYLASDQPSYIDE